jgi:hypothetical protein
MQTLADTLNGKRVVIEPRPLRRRVTASQSVGQFISGFLTKGSASCDAVPGDGRARQAELPDTCPHKLFGFEAAVSTRSEREPSSCRCVCKRMPHGCTLGTSHRSFVCPIVHSIAVPELSKLHGAHWEHRIAPSCALNCALHRRAHACLSSASCMVHIP